MPGRMLFREGGRFLYQINDASLDNPAFTIDPKAYDSHKETSAESDGISPCSSPPSPNSNPPPTPPPRALYHDLILHRLERIGVKPGCRNTCERSLVVSVVFVAVVLLILFIVVGIIAGSNRCKEPVAEQKFCTGPLCFKLASEILDSMNSSASPCHDFYQYACGGWVRNTKIPQNTTPHYWFPKFALEQKILQFYRDELASDSNPNDIEAFNTVRKFFKSCMDMSRRDAFGLSPVVTLIKSFGTLDVFTDRSPAFNPLIFELTTRLVSLARVGSFPLFRLETIPNGTESGGNVIVVKPPVVWDEVFRKGRPDLKKAHRLYDTSYSIDEVAVKEVVDFTTIIQTHASGQTGNIYKDYIWKKYTLEEMSTKLTSRIDWRRFFDSLLLETIDNNYEVFVFKPSYFTRLGDLLEATSDKSTNNVLLTSLLLESLPHSSTLALDVYRSYVGALPSLWDSCYQLSWRLFRTAMEAMFVRKHFTNRIYDAQMTTEIKNIFENVQEEFISNLETVKWLDATSRSASKEKAWSLKVQANVPQPLQDDHLVNKASLVAVSSATFFNNVVNANRRHVDKLIGSLKGQQYRDWSIAVTSVAVQYSPLQNTIVVPAGILQSPFYHPEGPRCLNYGTIGVEMARQYSKAFDYEGHLFDKNGRFNSTWSSETASLFNASLPCFIKLYEGMRLTAPPFSNITFQVDGKKTVLENVRDAAGIKIAFRSYRRWAEAEGGDRMLPGFPSSFRPDHLFFISIAQTMCFRGDDQSLSSHMKTEDFTPLPARIRAYVSNLKEFSDVFGCQSGAKMNPAEKCTLW